MPCDDELDNKIAGAFKCRAVLLCNISTPIIIPLNNLDACSRHSTAISIINQLELG